MSGMRRTLIPIALAAATALGALVAPGAAADEGNTILLGAAISESGKYSTNGQHTRNGYDLAVERIAEMGGIKVGDKTYNLEIIYYDDESTPARGAQLAERLINQDGVQFMLGPYSSGLTKAIAPVTEKYKIPMVEGNGASRSLFTQGYRYLFAVLSTSEQYLASSIQLAAEMAEASDGSASDVTVALAFENDPFSQDVRAGVIADAERYGMTIVIDEKLPPELNDMAATLLKVRALKPDVLAISGHAKGAITAIRQVAEMKVNVPMLALTHCDSAQIIDKFGADAEDTLCASQWAPTMTYSGRWFGSAGDYAEAFEYRYGYAPPYQAAESTASVLTFVDAFERAGSIDREAVRDALAATDMQTFYGNIRFDETGKNIAKPMVLYQVQDGEYKVVAPIKWAAAELIWPRPDWSERE
jgi:branched-chain amino acid transport system substrate-binding protein